MAPALVEGIFNRMICRFGCNECSRYGRDIKFSGLLKRFGQVFRADNFITHGFRLHYFMAHLAFQFDHNVC